MVFSLANNVVCRVAFGTMNDPGNSNKFLEVVDQIQLSLTEFNVGDYFPGMDWINRFNGVDKRIRKNMRELDRFFDKAIEEHRGSRLRSDSDIEDIIDVLLRVQKDPQEAIRLTDEHLKGVLIDMLLGGTDTGFTTLEWAMTELLRNPMMMKKLQSEVKGIMNGKQEDIMDEELEKMQYLKAVVKETLRYHTPIPFLAREAREDAKIMGYDIAAGTFVIINTWAIGRDSASWDEPDKFQPARFLSCSTDFKGQDFELIPFGAGRRSCPGIGFAMASVELVLANLVHKFEWGLPNGMKWEDLDCEEDPGTTIHRKNPLLAVPKRCHF
ncbi:hypothetical protein ACS0TY_034920 [Phlomoides rotata]